MAEATSSLLDPQTIQRAELLGLQARQIVEGYMAGAHRSPFRGIALEFAQHREYVPGDDTRHLDYKVLGRTDRYYLKQYEQETNYVAQIMLDGSESMKFGSGHLTKFDYARQMAATLAYLILLQRDAVSVGIFDQTMRERQPRTDSLAKIHQIMTVLAAFEPTAKTNVAQMLHDLAAQFRRKGIVILISDMLDDEEKIIEGIQHLRFNGHEVIVFHVMDHAEIAFDMTGTVEFIGLEGGPRLTTQPSALRKTYLAELNAFRERVRAGCDRNKCHYIFVDTSQPWHEVLSAYLASRQHTGF
jgi:uncharacterized protein (DUF58 family)